MGSTAQAEEDVAAAPQAPLELKLLSGGAPPRRALRYVWNAYLAELATFDMTSAESLETEGQTELGPASPAMHVSLALSARSASDDGRLAFDWKVQSVKAGNSTSSRPSLFELQIEAMQDLHGRGLIDARGFTTGVAIAATADASTSAARSARVVDILSDVAAALPEEAVGQGARWEKVYYVGLCRSSFAFHASCSATGTA